MQTHHLVPECGWDNYSKNKNVSEFIFDELAPLANSGKLDYENFVVGFGEFSDDSGFCSMEFFVPENDDEIEVLLKLQINFDSETNNLFALLDRNLKEKFQLIETL